MEWKLIEPSEKEYPERVVQNSVEGFHKATRGLVDLVVVEKDVAACMASRLDSEFQFTLYLVSDRVEGYRMKIMDFGYDVTINPIKFKLEPTIGEQVFGERQKGYSVAEDESQFATMLA